MSAARPTSWIEDVEEVTDADGQTVRAGDRVVYATTWGRSPRLRFGHVLHIARHERGYGSSHVKIRIQPEDDAWGPAQTVYIEAALGRFVKVAAR
ncbi:MULTISPECIES: hypothetical protein [unclassified Microbacterium]|uniref:hypothetical protein n=1 Tax=unclassified Microbacterium TaxID=2609290 RepID=UPI0030199B80